MLLATQIVTSSQIYWLTRLDGINSLLHFLVFSGVACVILNIVSVIVMSSDNPSKDDLKNAGRLLKFLVFCTVPVTLLLMVTSTLTPTTKEALLIYGIPAVVNNDKVQEKAMNAMDGTEDLLKLAKDYVAKELGEELHKGDKKESPSK